jgi:hypothetical protein
MPSFLSEKTLLKQQLGFFSDVWTMHFAMMAFYNNAKCPMKRLTAATGWHVAVAQHAPGCARGRQPTVKKPRDDMTNDGMPVNMHAVLRAACPGGRALSQ